MVSEMLFTDVFLSTLVTIRIIVFCFPVPGPTVLGLRLHHYMYGLLCVFVALFLRVVPLYAFGLALFADELTFLVIGGRTHEDNYSLVSMLGTGVVAVLAVLLRRHLLTPFS